MVKKASAWSVRIDEIPGVTREVVSAWCSKYNAVLCVREETDDETPNPHYHMALRTEEVSQETVRNWVKKVFGDSPYSRSDFATAVWDGEDSFLRYCCKGPDWQDVKSGKTKQMDSPRQPDVVFTQLLIITTVELSREFWAQNKAKGELVKKGKTKSPELVDEVVARVRAKIASMEITDTWLSKCETANEILMDIYKGKVNDHVIFPILQSCMYHLDRKVTVADQFGRMLKKFSRA